MIILLCNEVCNSIYVNKIWKYYHFYLCCRLSHPFPLSKSNLSFKFLWTTALRDINRPTWQEFNRHGRQILSWQSILQNFIIRSIRHMLLKICLPDNLLGLKSLLSTSQQLWKSQLSWNNDSHMLFLSFTWLPLHHKHF